KKTQRTLRRFDFGVSRRDAMGHLYYTFLLDDFRYFKKGMAVYLYISGLYIKKLTFQGKL
ncbi:MAG: hypothetical protein NWP83_05025, partial [Spirosomaceae bacterium]|nr:hypothetical protein [Spirosomataceae bacterium]